MPSIYCCQYEGYSIHCKCSAHLRPLLRAVPFVHRGIVLKPEINKKKHDFLDLFNVKIQDGNGGFFLLGKSCFS